MDIPATSSTTTPNSPEVQQALLMKKQIRLQQVQTLQLVDSAHTDPQPKGEGEPTVGRYLNSKA